MDSIRFVNNNKEMLDEVDATRNCRFGYYVLRIVVIANVLIAKTLDQHVKKLSFIRLGQGTDLGGLFATARIVKKVVYMFIHF